MFVFVLLNNYISISSIKISKVNATFVFILLLLLLLFFFYIYIYIRVALASSSEKSKTRLMRLRLLLAVKIELGYISLFIFTWITAPLHRPVDGIVRLFTNEKVSALLSLAIDVPGAFAAASPVVEVELNISDIFFCFS